MEIAKLVLEYVKVLIWPAVALTAIVMFRVQVRTLMASLRHVKLPGGTELDWQRELRAAEQAAEQVEASPRAAEAPVATEGVAQLSMDLYRYGFLPSSTGYDWTYYKQIAERDPNLALVGLRMEIERMLQNMAAVSRVTYDPVRTSLGKFAGLLRSREVLEQSEYDLLRSIINVANAALHGRDVSVDDARRVIEWAEAFKDTYLSFMAGSLDRMEAEGIQPPWPGAPAMGAEEPFIR